MSGYCFTSAIKKGNRIVFTRCDGRKSTCALDGYKSENPCDDDKNAKVCISWCKTRREAMLVLKDWENDVGDESDLEYLTKPSPNKVVI